MSNIEQALLTKYQEARDSLKDNPDGWDDFDMFKAGHKSVLAEIGKCEPVGEVVMIHEPEWMKPREGFKWYQTDFPLGTKFYTSPQPIEKCEPVPPIEYDADMNRYYIPMIGGWEIQTKGKGSTFRICNTKTHVRWPVLDEHLHEALEQMAKDNRHVYASPISKEREGLVSVPI